MQNQRKWKNTFHCGIPVNTWQMKNFWGTLLKFPITTPSTWKTQLNHSWLFTKSSLPWQKDFSRGLLRNVGLPCFYQVGDYHAVPKNTKTHWKVPVFGLHFRQVIENTGASNSSWLRIGSCHIILSSKWFLQQHRLGLFWEDCIQSSFHITVFNQSFNPLEQKWSNIYSRQAVQQHPPHGIAGHDTWPISG